MKPFTIALSLVLVCLVFLALGTNQRVFGQRSDTKSISSGGGMPGYPIPDKPIPHHEPGQPSRAGSYRTQVVRENELGAQEVVEISGLDAMAADGIDPMAGNYNLVNWDSILMSTSGESENLALNAFKYTSQTISPIGSEQEIGTFIHNDIAAADLNNDGQAEQISVWIDETSKSYHMRIGELPDAPARATSTPAAIIHANGDIDLLVRGYDEALWHRHYSTGTWGEWKNDAGGMLLSAPTVVSTGDGLFDVFVVGPDNLTYQLHWNGSVWGAEWTAIDKTTDWSAMEFWVGPTPELPAPAAVARGSGIDLFRLGPDNTLRWNHSTDGTSWGGWESLGGMLASGPGVMSIGADHVQIFARGVDEALWFRTYNSSWGAWQRAELNGDADDVNIASPPAVSASGSVYVRGSDNQIWYTDCGIDSCTEWDHLEGMPNNPLASGVALAGGNYLFIVRTETGEIEYSPDGVTWTNWGGMEQLAGEWEFSQSNINPRSRDIENLSIDVEVGYFKGDGRPQIVVAFECETTKICLQVYDVGEGFTPILRVGQSLAGHHPRFATGDIDGDGTDEIGIVHLNDGEHGYDYHYKVEKIDVTFNFDASTWAISKPEKASPLFDSCVGSCEWGEDDWHEFGGTFNISAGDFDGDGKDEMAIQSNWTDERESPGDNNWSLWVQLYIFDNDQIPAIESCSPIDPDCPMLKQWRKKTDDDDRVEDGQHTGVALATGDLNADGHAEIILTWPFQFDVNEKGERDWPDLIRSLQVLRIAEENSITNCELIGESSENWWSRHSFLDSLVVGDFDRDLDNEIAFFRPMYGTLDEDGDDGLAIFEFTPSEPSEPSETALKQVAYLPVDVRNNFSTRMAAGNFTWESIRVGQPSYRVQNRVDTLISVINMPPKHQDLIEDAAGDYQLIESPIGECDPSPDSPNCTHAKFARQDYESSEQTIATQHAYELSAGMENKVCAGGGLEGVAEVKACARTSINATHGGNFEKSREEIESIGFRRKVIAANDDKIVYFGTPYGVWEYPVLSDATGEPVEDVFITVAFPLVSMTQYPDSSGGYFGGTCDETWFNAGHQPNNVWSYDPIGDITFPDYNTDYEPAYDAFEADWAEGEITYDHLQSAFSSVKFNHSISARAEIETTAEANLGAVNVSSNFKAYAQADYSNSFLNTDKLTTSQNTTFSYFLAPQPDSAKFLTRILLYRGKDDAQIINYQAEPGRSATWQLYDRPDPAFILPWYGFPNPDNPQVPPCGEAKKLYSPAIVIDPPAARQGETVTINATVRNFSNEQAQNVRVRFYHGDPADNIIIGERLIPDLARVTGPREVSITWEAQGVGTQKIFAVIDPDGDIPEVHDEADEADGYINNNKAYGLLQLSASADADMGAAAKQPYDRISYNLADPRPSVSFYMPRASLDAVATFEVKGVKQEEIPLPPGAKVFEFVAYQGSKYKLWNEPIADFNLKPEPNDPPAVVIVAYTPAELAAMSESDLNLYRLDGAFWREAICPGYGIERFPEDVMIAVPVCQTGVFAFSDHAPDPLWPLAMFGSTPPTTGDIPLTVFFSDMSTGGPTTWEWDFGDGETSIEQNPSHTYMSSGIYDVMLTVSNDAGSDTHVDAGYIVAAGFVADFAASPTGGEAPLEVSFIDQSSGYPDAPTGWLWDFGDGNTSTEQNPTHTYTQNGVYTVTLEVESISGSDTLVVSNFIIVFDIFETYLPLILKDYRQPAPDLVVKSITATTDNVQVVIKNVGSAPVNDAFWVDVYIDPVPAPTHVNQLWHDLSDQGLVWGVVAPALPIDPGEELILTYQGDYYYASESSFSENLPLDTPVYAQVDSAHTGTDYGGVWESHERMGELYNNITGPVMTTPGTMERVKSAGQFAVGDKLPPRR